MTRTEPQITEIASYLATALPTEGSEPAQAVDAWRHALRYAREAGAIDTITDMIRSDAAGDPRAEAYCDALRT